MSSITVAFCAHNLETAEATTLLKAIESLPLPLGQAVKIVKADCLDHCAACAAGPIVEIDGEVYAGLTPDELKSLLAKLIHQSQA
ncbi:MAG: DUF1450 domain-containing protein [Syntrophothermus sp.]